MPAGRSLTLRALVAIAALACAGAATPRAHAAVARAFTTRPDLQPPVVNVRATSPGLAPGYLALAPKQGPGQAGPLLVDDTGEPLWFRPLPRGQAATDFRVQRYRGRPVLTWWQGTIGGGSGEGQGIIADSSYRIVKRVRAPRGYTLDLHEFTLSRRGTALVTIYHPVRRDLRSAGGRRNGVVIDGIVEEIDVATGRVRFQWHSLDHVALSESYASARDRSRPGFDYFHVNSVGLDSDGDYLVSARNTCAIYKIDRRTGRIVWRLGGKRSSFRMGPGAAFAFQHDARREADGTITLFNNGRARSRGLALALDMHAMTATVARELPHPGGIFARSQGDVELQPNGDMLVGWGSARRFSEFDGTGRMLFDASLAGGYDTYRVYRVAWEGRPTTPPAVAAAPGTDGGTVVYASWSGATQVARWVVLAGSDPTALAPVATAPRTGFETTIALPSPAPYVAVQAQDAFGATLGTSPAAKG